MKVKCNRTYIYKGQIIRSGDDVSKEAAQAIQEKEKKFAERLKQGTNRKLLNQDAQAENTVGDAGISTTHTDIPDDFTARQALIDAGFTSLEEIEALDTAAILKIKGVSQADGISIAKQLGKVS